MKSKIYIAQFLVATLVLIFLAQSIGIVKISVDCKASELSEYEDSDNSEEETEEENDLFSNSEEDLLLLENSLIAEIDNCFYSIIYYSPYINSLNSPPELQFIF